MVTEVVFLIINPLKETQFESDFKVAQKYIRSIKGFQSLALQKCIDKKGKYMLLVNWDSIESHKVGFRKSEAYKSWKALLHTYYNPVPKVEYYKMIE